MGNRSSERGGSCSRARDYTGGGDTGGDVPPLQSAGVADVRQKGRPDIYHVSCHLATAGGMPEGGEGHNESAGDDGGKFYIERLQELGVKEAESMRQLSFPCSLAHATALASSGLEGLKVGR